MVIFLYKSENAMSMFPHAFLNKLINNTAYTETPKAWQTLNYSSAILKKERLNLPAW